MLPCLMQRADNPSDTTAPQADELAADILMPRERPLVLVSTASDGGFAFDIGRLRADLDGLAAVGDRDPSRAADRLALRGDVGRPGAGTYDLTVLPAHGGI